MNADADDGERFRRMEVFLDRGLGACALRDARIARVVQDNLWFHDGGSYRLLAWCVMPNHVHVLAEMAKPLAVVLKNWKSYTGSQANKLLGTIGETFWQADYFDRYIRDEEHFRRVVRYIENNPVKAGLVRELAEWPWSSAPYRGRYGSDEPPQIPTERGQPCPREGESSETTPLEKIESPADRAVRAPDEIARPRPENLMEKPHAIPRTLSRETSFAAGRGGRCARSGNRGRSRGLRSRCGSRPFP